MPARLTAYLPEGAAVETVLPAGRGLQVGRAPPSDLLIDHPSVSRCHARLEPEGDGWRLLDLDSKNGSFIDGSPAEGRRLPANAWLRFGDVTCELVQLDEQALARAGERRAARQTASVLHQRAIERSQAPSDLLQATLAAVVDLADCERGFLLVNQSGGPVVRAWQGLDDRALAAPSFDGSRGAVDRALRERRPVVINDAGHDAAFASRASVIAGGLRSLVCLPLVAGDEVLGLAYADSRTPGHAITTLELELLAAFAERAALWLAARRSELALAEVARQFRWPGATGAAA
ncbi:GAF domain-containing protein [Arenimonas sp.]|uniref:GAF domain-containing protein n=1 Tax=Arenimonas sp. TaxID=1872635 RepID=UPI0035AF8EF1